MRGSDESNLQFICESGHQRLFLIRLWQCRHSFSSNHRCRSLLPFAPQPAVAYSLPHQGALDSGNLVSEDLPPLRLRHPRSRTPPCMLGYSPSPPQPLATTCTPPTLRPHARLPLPQSRPFRRARPLSSSPQPRRITKKCAYDTCPAYLTPSPGIQHHRWYLRRGRRLRR